jgi:hypothetical protein
MAAASGIKSGAAVSATRISLVPGGQTRCHLSQSNFLLVNLQLVVPPCSMSQQPNQYRQQNPNALPSRDAPKAPEVIEYICGGTLGEMPFESFLLSPPLLKSLYGRTTSV